MKVYVIESCRDYSHNKQWRFRSLIIDMRDPWDYDESTVIKEAEQHQAIMERIYPQLKDDYVSPSSLPLKKSTADTPQIKTNAGGIEIGVPFPEKEIVMNQFKTGTKEFYDLMDQFEKDMLDVFYGHKYDREDKSMNSKGAFYTSGDVNKMFQAYMRGYTYRRSMEI